MNLPEQSPAALDETGPAHPPLARIKAFGAGTAGTNILEQFLSKGFPDTNAVALNPGLTASTANHKLVLSLGNPQGALAPGGPPPACAQEETAAQIKALCEHLEIAFIVAGLGGKSGTRLAPTLARAAKERGALVVGFAVMPFTCEGNLRSETAELGLRELREAADLVIALPNDRALAVVPEGASLLETFKASNDLVATAAHGIWQALLSTNLMGLTFTDLCRITRELSTEASFAAVETTGLARVKESLDRVFAHPMLAGAESLKEAAAVSVMIIGGPGLAVTDVNAVMERVRQESGTAPVVMGAATRPGPDDRLLVGLLVARQQGATGAEHGLSAQPGASVLAPRTTPKPGDHAEDWLVRRGDQPRPGARIVPPPPEMSQERMEELRTRQMATRGRKTSGPRLRQTTLPLEIVSKGRFDKSEPTIHKGEDLDVPTYIRRGVQLN